MARLLLPIVLATLFLPASAAAHGRLHRSHASSATHRLLSARHPARGKLAGLDPVALATLVAERYWGAVPCGGQVTVLPNQPLAAGLEPSTDGWVTFGSSLGQNDLQAPAGSYTQCTISLAHWQWPTDAAMGSDWNMFCLTVVHEMGHLLGHPHSLIPDSVMAPVFTSEAYVPRLCRTSRQSDARAAARPHVHP